MSRRLELGLPDQPSLLMFNSEYAADVEERDGGYLVTTAYGDQQWCADLRSAGDFTASCELWRAGDGLDPMAEAEEWAR